MDYRWRCLLMSLRYLSLRTCKCLLVILSLMPTDADQHSLLTIKGAPEILLDRITSYVGSGGIALPLDEVTRNKIEVTKNEWASQGRRVILVARKAISGATIPANMSSTTLETEMNNQARSGLTLVGLVGIVDPPRPEIPSVIDTLRKAGIRIFMVSYAPSQLMSLRQVLANSFRSLVILHSRLRQLRESAVS